jgi:lincosamide nucleotidyltransferase A/C/D/E
MFAAVPRTGDTASAWTRSTDRANAVLWELPLPRRPKVLLSQLIFQNPPMPRERVLATLATLDAAGLRTVMLGGWGIDALVGRELRKHRDLDLAVEVGDLERALEVLATLGYARWNEYEAPAPVGPLTVERAVSCRDEALRVVDLHGADLTRLETDKGLIGGHEVVCLSAEHQLQSQVGRSWTPARMRSRRVNKAALRKLLATRTGSSTPASSDGKDRSVK